MEEVVAAGHGDRAQARAGLARTAAGRGVGWPEELEPELKEVRGRIGCGRLADVGDGGARGRSRGPAEQEWRSEDGAGSRPAGAGQGDGGDGGEGRGGARVAGEDGGGARPMGSRERGWGERRGGERKAGSLA